MTTTFIIYAYISMNNSKVMRSCNKTVLERTQEWPHPPLKLSQRKQLSSLQPLPMPPPMQPSSVRKEAREFFTMWHTEPMAGKLPSPASLSCPSQTSLRQPWRPLRLPLTSDQVATAREAGTSPATRVLPRQRQVGGSKTQNHLSRTAGLLGLFM